MRECQTALDKVLQELNQHARKEGGEHPRNEGPAGQGAAAMTRASIAATGNDVHLDRALRKSASGSSLPRRGLGSCDRLTSGNRRPSAPCVPACVVVVSRLSSAPCVPLAARVGACAHACCLCAHS